ncbi:hypothetical protein [Priestia aryabhattai]|uniref:hypothetical protein n=1 Tax=Priestia aryabhattai TaxID=412384 RepID=UPI002E242016|nr:hypothetical protein [Priestia aryabhattai]MED4262169.1 hypothetical protein [Priestia aryabhattai]
MYITTNSDSSFRRKLLIVFAIIFLGVAIGIVSSLKPILAVGLLAVPFVLMGINYKIYLFFTVVVSQIFIGLITMFVPMQVNFGTIDNAYKAIVFTSFSFLMIYIGLMKGKNIVKTPSIN